MYEQAEKIISKKAFEYGSSVERIKGRIRTPKLVKIRTWCMREIQVYTDLSMAEIGKLFDNRDRSTILRLLQNTEEPNAA